MNAIRDLFSCVASVWRRIIARAGNNKNFTINGQTLSLYECNFYRANYVWLLFQLLATAVGIYINEKRELKEFSRIELAHSYHELEQKYIENLDMMKDIIVTITY